jgi:hypothetical protein
MRGGAVSEALFRDGLCLPSGSGMNGDELARVIEVVEEAGSGPAACPPERDARRREAERHGKALAGVQR